MEIDLNKFISEIDFNANKYNYIGNGILLTNREIDILNKYKINYKKCNSLKEILFEVEDILNDMDIVDEELDYISSTIAERDYYQNTNK